MPRLRWQRYYIIKNLKYQCFNKLLWICFKQKHKMTSKKEKVLATNRRHKEPNENFETEK